MIKVETKKVKHLFCDLCQEQIKYSEDQAGFEHAQMAFGDFCDSCKRLPVVGVIKLTTEQIEGVKKRYELPKLDD